MRHLNKKQQGPWKWGAYYNPNDSRIFVPKRNPYMGWTINIGRPVGKRLFIGTFAAVFAILGWVAYAGAKDYQFKLTDTELTINAAMYSRTYRKDQIASVTLVDKLPHGIRTNGYGGIKKAYGHFRFEVFGKSMVYLYRDVHKYIIIELQDDKSDYLILNEKTPQTTETLYQTITDWLAK